MAQFLGTGDGTHEEERSARLQVVGVDGSDCSTQALRWAAARRELLGDVEPIVAWQYPWWAFVPTATGTITPPGRGHFEDIAGRLAANVLDRLDSSTFREPVVVHGSAGPALVAAGERASLVVVGSRGRNAVASRVLGSVGAHCVHHATVPVAIVPPGAHVDARFQRVVVGVDGSEYGAAALWWAMANTPASSEIVVMNVWRSDVVNPELAGTAAALFRAESEQLVAATIEGVADRAARDSRTISGHTESGDPRNRLRSEAEEADLLVVGARGTGLLEHLFLGSVASSLANQPLAPTVIVR
ncbi:MAG: universal stress protein [Acidimicrobiales bacterium]